MNGTHLNRVGINAPLACPVFSGEGGSALSRDGAYSPLEGGSALSRDGVYSPLEGSPALAGRGVDYG